LLQLLGNVGKIINHKGLKTESKTKHRGSGKTNVKQSERWGIFHLSAQPSFLPSLLFAHVMYVYPYVCMQRAWPTMAAS